MDKQQFTETLKELAEEKAPAADLWPEIERKATRSTTPWTRGLQLAGGLAGATLVLLAVLLFASWMASFSQESAQPATGQDLQLLANTIRPEDPTPGDTLTVTLRWQTPGRPQPNLHVFIHLVDQADQVVAQVDTPLPEAAWPIPQTVTTSHQLQLPTRLSPGVYTLQAGIYDQSTQQRLPLIAAGERLESGTVTLGTATIAVADERWEQGPWAGQPLYSESAGVSPAAHDLFLSCGLGDRDIEAAAHRFKASGSTRQVIQPGLSDTSVPWRKFIDVTPLADGLYRVSCLRLDGDAPVPPSPEAMAANVGLVSYQLPHTTLVAGETLAASTTWSNGLDTLPPVDQRIRLLDQAGNPVAVIDRAVPFEVVPGGITQVGFTDTLYLPSTLGPGQYQLEVGLYARASGWSVPFHTWAGDIVLAGRMPLATVKIVEETPAAATCPVTEPVYAQPPDDPNADPFARADWYINEDQTIWAGPLPPDNGKWRTGGEKVFWIRPAGTNLQITGHRLDGGAPPLQATIPCCYPTGFQVTGLDFPTPGCWEVTGRAGENELRFVAEVEPADEAVGTGISLDLASVDKIGSNTWATLAVNVDLSPWNVNPNNSGEFFPSVTLHEPIVRDALGNSYQPQMITGDTPDRWQDPYPAEVTLSLETLPVGTYTLETGIALTHWPADRRLTVDLDGHAAGDRWPLAETLTIGRLRVPLENATLLTRNDRGGEELLLQIATTAPTVEGMALTCLHLDPDLAALGLSYGRSECQPELVDETVGRITATTVIAAEAADGSLNLPSTVRLNIAGDLSLDGPWYLTWDIPGE